MLRKLPKLSSESSFADLYHGVWGGRAQKWSNLAAFRGPDPMAGGFSGGHPTGLENWHDERSILMRFRGAVSGAVQAVWDGTWQFFQARWKPFLGTRRPFALRLFVKKCTRQHAPLLLSFRPPPRAQV